MKGGKETLFGLCPTFKLEVKSNIGKIIFKLLDKHFRKSSELHNIYNINTLKLCYSYSSNLETTP